MPKGNGEVPSWRCLGGLRLREVEATDFDGEAGILIPGYNDSTI